MPRPKKTYQVRKAEEEGGKQGKAAYESYRSNKVLTEHMHIPWGQDPRKEKAAKRAAPYGRAAGQEVAKYGAAAGRESAELDKAHKWATTEGEEAIGRIGTAQEKGAPDKEEGPAKKKGKTVSYAPDVVEIKKPKVTVSSKLRAKAARRLRKKSYEDILKKRMARDVKKQKKGDTSRLVPRNIREGMKRGR